MTRRGALLRTLLPSPGEWEDMRRTAGDQMVSWALVLAGVALLTWGACG